MAKRMTQKTIKGVKELPNIKKSTDGDFSVWYFTKIDKAGKFAFDVKREDFQQKEVLEKMIHYSNMSWTDIKRQTHDNGKSKHHFLPYDELSKEAKKRLKDKQLMEDSDSIFSFALQNKLRIIGIRRDEKFYVLWYDSEHEICPSHKKHT